MQINKIQICINPAKHKALSRVSKAIDNVKSPTLRMFGPGAAGLYGEYVVKKAVNDLSENADDKTILTKIGFGEEIQNKILNKKNSNGKLIFDKKMFILLSWKTQLIHI